MNPQRGLWGWLFQRITGAYLVFGLIVHVIVTHFVTRSVTFEWVSERLQNGWWLAFDLSLLFVAFYHGFNGLWGIALDFNPSPKWRRAIAWGLFAVAVGWVIYGIFVLIPFAG
jgi:succinate dehydrogenase / fumarate reductase membrane anchor subunit